MSLETQRRLLLSEWRLVVVSQTSHPIMYRIERPLLSREELRCFPGKYAIVKIPLGNRIITKWQEQVRPLDDDDDQWYVVREWTEAEIGRNYNIVEANSDSEASSNRVQDRTQLHRILSEVGLNPGDYTFSPSQRGNQPQEQPSNHPSAFSSYPAQQQQTKNNKYLLQSQSFSSSGQSIAFAQQPPPPLTQPPASQPPPPPPSSQPLQALSSLFNRDISNTQNTNSQLPQDMSQHILSPRRTPPEPPHSFVSHHNESNLSAEHYLREINCADNPPVKVVKPNTQNVVYRKEIRIRYLQPPTPPPPAPIIIREKRIPPIPPQSPLLIRERKPEARTPPPLTIRERPPTPPAPLEPYVIDKNIPPPPPQPRQIIIERLPTPPPKPRTVIFEKWLPYKKVKRPVLLQKAPPPEPPKVTRNVIIEYEPLKAFTVRRVIEEGIFRVDPHQYASYNAQTHTGGDVRVVERIEDLPPPSEKLAHVLNEYNYSSASPANCYSHESHQHLSEHIPSSVQHLLSGAQTTSNTDYLTNVSRASNTPAVRQERVLSTVKSLNSKTWYSSNQLQYIRDKLSGDEFT
ncbi:unnamed protein product [Rotaria magnacalcarata]|uniref:Uncharacterized protein n=1 Tax=Rotaria magnacalcarata TaxID=392030 RepID=A0A8S2KXU5_9BILA|nr:unnamed protein product [Rotaria magnacalcarata]